MMHKPKVLFVDDYDLCREYLRRVALDYDVEFTYAENLQSALEAAKQVVFDILIADFIFSKDVYDGSDIVSEIQKVVQIPKVYFISGMPPEVIEKTVETKGIKIDGILKKDSIPTAIESILGDYKIK